MRFRSSLVFVEAAFQVRSQRDEDSGNYSTQILATHGMSRTTKNLGRTDF